MNSLGPAKFVSYNRNFIIIGRVNEVNVDLGQKKFFSYNQELVINKFVIIEFECTVKPVLMTTSQQ
jgi:hypothetical protein